MYENVKVISLNDKKKLFRKKEPVLTDEEQGALERALQKREEFINSLPGERREQAMLFQAKIDHYLASAGNFNNRLTIINMLLMDSFQEMAEALLKLKSCLERSFTSQNSTHRMK